MGSVKVKKDKSVKDNKEKPAKVRYVSPIATPYADKKLVKKVKTLLGKERVNSKRFYRGIKDVCKAIRKGNTGLVLLAGDISPDDCISHMPVLCEDNNIPYVFVPSKEDLGKYVSTKRATSCVMVVPEDKKYSGDDSYQPSFDEVVSGIEELP